MILHGFANSDRYLGIDTCKLDSDNLDTAQQAHMNGPVIVYRLGNDNMTEEEYRHLPADLQALYLRLLHDRNLERWKVVKKWR